MSLKKETKLEEAEEIADDFLSRTKDLFRKSLVASSIRRREPVVHDIDIAVIPKIKDFGPWKDTLTRRVKEIGGRVVSFGDTITNFRYRGSQINLFLCLNPDSWGVVLMWATGPKGHTIGMTIKARDRGLIINSKGLWTRDEPPLLIKASTEEEVGKLLGWEFKPPEARGRGSKSGAAARQEYP